MSGRSMAKRKQRDGKRTHCPTCGLAHTDPNADDRTECAKCARLRALTAERYTHHRRRNDG